MSTCPRCGAEVPEGAKFCVMCGYGIAAQPTTDSIAYGTSTLTGSGLVVSLATAAIAACIVIGIIVLVERFAG